MSTIRRQRRKKNSNRYIIRFTVLIQNLICRWFYFISKAFSIIFSFIFFCISSANFLRLKKFVIYCSFGLKLDVRRNAKKFSPFFHFLFSFFSFFDLCFPFFISSNVLNIYIFDIFQYSWWWPKKRHIVHSGKSDQLFGNETFDFEFEFGGLAFGRNDPAIVW